MAPHTISGTGFSAVSGVSAGTPAVSGGLVATIGGEEGISRVSGGLTIPSVATTTRGISAVSRVSAGFPEVSGGFVSGGLAPHAIGGTGGISQVSGGLAMPLVSTTTHGISAVSGVPASISGVSGGFVSGGLTPLAMPSVATTTRGSSAVSGVSAGLPVVSGGFVSGGLAPHAIGGTGSIGQVSRGYAIPSVATTTRGISAVSGVSAGLPGVSGGFVSGGLAPHPIGGTGVISQVSGGLAMPLVSTTTHGISAVSGVPASISGVSGGFVSGGLTPHAIGGTGSI